MRVGRLRRRGLYLLARRLAREYEPDELCAFVRRLAQVAGCWELDCALRDHFTQTSGRVV